MKRFLSLHPTEALLSADAFHHLLHHVHLLDLSSLFMHHPKIYTELHRKDKCPWALCCPFHHSQAPWSPGGSMKLSLHNIVYNACACKSLNSANHTFTKRRFRDPSSPSSARGLLIHQHTMWAFWCALPFQIPPLCQKLLPWHIQPFSFLHQCPTKQRERGATAGCTIELKLWGTRSWLPGTKKDHAVLEDRLDHCIVNF